MIDVYKFSASFFVETKHSSDLEFVLSDAGARNSRDYPQLLWNMMEKNIGHARVKGGQVSDLKFYGDLAFTVKASTAEELQRALGICTDTVKTWIYRYRVNGMTRSIT